MPYIKHPTRQLLDPSIDALSNDMGDTAGSLAYAVTRLTLEFIEWSADRRDRERSFADYAAALGVLEAVKLELYRQQMAAYEDGKLAENGPVAS